MEWPLAAIRLTLFYFNSMRGRFHFDSIEMQMKSSNLLETISCFYKLGIALKLSMARYLTNRMIITNKDKYKETYLILN